MRIKIIHITAIDMSLIYLLKNQLLDIKKAGYDVSCMSSSGPNIEKLLKLQLNHISVTISRNLSPFKDIISLWRLYHILRKGKYQIVHTHTPKPSFLGQIAAYLAGVPIVVNTLHGFYFHEFMNPLSRRFFIIMEKISARCSDLIFSQNHEDIRTAVDERICTPKQIMYLGNGIDLEEFNPTKFSNKDVINYKKSLGISNLSPVVGFVGRLAAKRKGFLDFLEAGKALASNLPQVRFLIVGSSDQDKPDAVRPSVAEDYGIGNVCYFLGHRPNHELPLLYKVMDVLVLPSLFEGIPRVVMEASAMGVPIVATDVKGNREAVEHDHNGLLVPLGDIRALTNAIIKIINDIGKAQYMSQEGRRIAAERFDERIVFNKVKEGYTRLLQEKKIKFLK